VLHGPFTHYRCLPCVEVNRLCSINCIWSVSLPCRQMAT